MYNPDNFLKMNNNSKLKKPEIQDQQVNELSDIEKNFYLENDKQDHKYVVSNFLP